jgi:hypothetical protein
MLAAGADAELTSLLAPLRWDLCFNPGRFQDGWQSAATAYHAAAGLLLSQAAEEVPHSTWRHSAGLRHRAERYRRLGLWCNALACKVAPMVDDRADVLEQAADACVGGAACRAVCPGGPNPESWDPGPCFLLLLQTRLLTSRSLPPRCCRLYSDMEPVPPRSDPLSPPAKVLTDPQLRSACERSCGYYLAAAAVLGDEYFYQLQIGRCMRWLGRPPAEWLPRMAAACRLAAVHHRGLLDPLCALHAARLELLRDMVAAAQRHVANPALAPALSVEHCATLRLLARYCFTREAQEMVATLLPAGAARLPGPEEVGRAVRAVTKDGKAALLWCLDKDKHYYPAALQ